MHTPTSALNKYFGYSQFRPLQEQIITDIINHKDTFVLMPTGGGKSICYQLPSLLGDGTTIVVSPLISLMKDQVDGLTQNGIAAAYLNSSQALSEQQGITAKLKNNHLKLLYVAPERLVQRNFLQLLQSITVNFFAIDEAHCISQWGHDFRPEYRQLDLIRREFPNKPIVALTATATPRVKTDIIERLQLQNAAVYQASFNRPNITYKILPKQNAFSQTLSYIQNHKDEAGIIYCQSRKTVDRVTARLREQGIKALSYHAGLDDGERKQNQEEFILENVNVIVATVAFGMGIDKPNVRYVIHYDLPRSLEHYYQETGRAGRDGLPSECILLYSYADKFFYERFIEDKQTEEERLIAKSQLNRMLDFAQSAICRRALLLQYFAESFTQTNCASCDNCLNPKETFDATVITQKILSCIYRTQQRFGINHIVNILVGSQAKNILQYGHDKLSTYNIIHDYTPSQIKTIIYELLQQGLLKQSDDIYGILSLSPQSTAVLKGNTKVILTKPIEIKFTAKTKTPKTLEQKNADHDLFARLRALRKRLADESHLPPYVIFSDKTLLELAAYFPQTESQFAEIYGVGQEKRRKYAQVFLKEIVSYCQPRNVKPIPKYK
jgi:ATP-dependent DNA helicase RecQ